MGCDCNVKLKGKVTVSELIAFLNEEFETKANADVTPHDASFVKQYVKDIYNKNEPFCSFYGYIGFTYNKKPTGVFYSYDNYNCYENLGYYESLGLTDMVKSEKTTLIVRTSPESVEMMKKIVSHFGGWIDENDCDDIPYYYVEKEEKQEQKEEENIRFCPFCNSTAVYITEREDPITGTIIPQLFCDSCKVIIEAENDSPYMDDNKTYNYLKDKLEKIISQKK